jgi:hypothetical protein
VRRIRVERQVPISSTISSFGFAKKVSLSSSRPSACALARPATVSRYDYETHETLRAHLSKFPDASNFARRLKTLRGLTPFGFISQRWTSEPHRSRVHTPSHRNIA